MCGHSRDQHLSSDDDAWAHQTFCTGSGVLGDGGCACGGYTEEPVCDFCMATPAPWTYPAHTASMPMEGGHFTVHVSVSDWAACEACAALIEDGNRVALAGRIALLPELTSEQESYVRAKLLHQHTIEFWNARSGDRYRHTPPKETP